MSRSAAYQPVQRCRPVQRRNRWERCATKAAAAAAGRPTCITTREPDESMESLGGQRTLLDKQRGVFCEPAVLYNHQNTRSSGLLTVCAPEEEFRVICDTSSTDLCPTEVASDGLSNTFSTLEADQTHTLSRTAFSESDAATIQWPFPAPRTVASRPVSLSAEPVERHPSLATAMATRNCRSSSTRLFFAPFFYPSSRELRHG